MGTKKKTLLEYQKKDYKSPTPNRQIRRQPSSRSSGKQSELEKKNHHCAQAISANKSENNEQTRNATAVAPRWLYNLGVLQERGLITVITTARKDCFSRPDNGDLEIAKARPGIPLKRGSRYDLGTGERN